eukprot:386913_1
MSTYSSLRECEKFVILLMILMSVVASIASVDHICFADMYGNYTANVLTTAWFNEIASNAIYNENFHAFTNFEADAYQAISSYLSPRAGLAPPTTDIRSKYNAIEPNNLGTLLNDLKTDGSVQSAQPPNCNSTCWSNVITQLHSEVTIISDLSEFVNEFVIDYFTQASIKFISAIAVVKGNLEYEATDTQIIVGSQTPGSWQAGPDQFVNAFAGLMGISAGPEEKLGLWALTTMSGFGNDFLNGHNTRTYNILVNLNNAIWGEASVLTDSFTTFVTDITANITIEQKAITQNYGKMVAFNECLQKLNAAKTELDI